uniref:Natural cytotoxicity triggering receptor 3 n=1 Tax=Pyxicephalus adspersus TaxID=30357 RepID=A0AAV3A456_PYXAD|nr:TPA: hypothetical protein GDO54_016579 [Pyxicephalus adspersus]
MLGFLSQMIHVQQIPVKWATEGSSVTLPCYYNISGGNTSIGSFKWYRHKAVSNVEVSDNSTHFHGRVSEADVNKFISEQSATITLHNVEKADLGMYFCEVRLLFSQEISGHGNGTFLNVTGEFRSWRGHYRYVGAGTGKFFSPYFSKYWNLLWETPGEPKN